MSFTRNRYGDTRFVWFIAGVLAVAGVVFGLIIAVLAPICFAIDGHICAREAQAMEREHRYGWAEGCMVQLDDGTYVDIDSYRISNEETGR